MKNDRAWLSEGITGHSYRRIETDRFIVTYRGIITTLDNQSSETDCVNRVAEQFASNKLNFDSLIGFYTIVIEYKETSEVVFWGDNSGSQRFYIDNERKTFSDSLSWRVNKDGYLAHFDHLMSIELLMHRWLMGVTDSRIIVDHANRDRLDCRRANLRIVTPSQNSANHGLFQTNKTGYTGVYYSRCSGRYEVKIGYNHRRILLGSTKNEEMLVTLAQMYNIGASFFFGDYAGALNDVPAPPDDLVKRIVTKCQKYMKAPAPASAFAA